MAYYTGSANDLTALRQALIDTCVLEGWSWNPVSEVLSKGALFLRLQVVSGYLTLLGRTSGTSGDAAGVVRIGQIGSTPLAFPLTYEIFAFAGEVYLVINYGIDFYQWCAFGGSSVQGLPGTGMWVAASLGAGDAASGVSVSATDGGSGGSTTTAALFWATNILSTANRNAWVHSDLDGQGWWLGQTLAGALVGIRPAVPLIGLLPNSWNSEAVLLPLRCYKIRPSNRISLVVDVEHARCTRVDNYTPGEIISIGSDRWKVFPWYRKDVTSRDGASAANHSGTFGWAIRYEGP